MSLQNMFFLFYFLSLVCPSGSHLVAWRHPRCTEIAPKTRPGCQDAPGRSPPDCAEKPRNPNPSSPQEHGSGKRRQIKPQTRSSPNGFFKQLLLPARGNAHVAKEPESAAQNLWNPQARRVRGRLGFRSKANAELRMPSGPLQTYPLSHAAKQPVGNSIIVSLNALLDQNIKLN